MKKRQLARRNVSRKNPAVKQTIKNILFMMQSTSKDVIREGIKQTHQFLGEIRSASAEQLKELYELLKFHTNNDPGPVPSIPVLAHSTIRLLKGRSALRKNPRKTRFYHSYYGEL